MTQSKHSNKFNRCKYGKNKLKSEKKCVYCDKLFEASLLDKRSQTKEVI